MCSKIEESCRELLGPKYELFYASRIKIGSLILIQTQDLDECAK